MFIFLNLLTKLTYSRILSIEAPCKTDMKLANSYLSIVSTYLASFIIFQIYDRMKLHLEKTTWEKDWTTRMFLVPARPLKDCKERHFFPIYFRLAYKL